MNTHNVQQGSPEWGALRAAHFTASEAPAMLGASKYQSRSALLSAKATGCTPEVAADKQRLFDRGHEAEAGARSIAERIIGDELYPATCTESIDGLPLLASLDGMTMDGGTNWEHKLWSADLAAQIEAQEIEPHYAVQLEQQMMVTGAPRVLFMCSDGTEARCAWMWYTPKGDWREKIIAGWRQFQADLSAYQHIEHAPEAVGRAPESLPALRIEVTGMVTASNLAEFKAHALALIGSINTDLQTDQDFADAEKSVKWAKDVEDRLDAAKNHALSQTASIDELFRTIDAIKEEARTKRLELDRLVKARKESIRGEIAQGAANALRDHYAQINATLQGRITLGIPASFQSDVGAAMKGKKTVSSLRDAADTALATGKIAANQTADKVRVNLVTLDSHREYAHLFQDLAALAFKEPDDFKSAVTVRIARHKENERLRLEREKAREADAKARQKRDSDIALELGRAEEAASIKRKEADQTKPSAAATPIKRPEVAAPTGAEIVESVSFAFGVSMITALGWIKEMDIESARTAIKARTPGYTNNRIAK